MERVPEQENNDQIEEKVIDPQEVLKDNIIEIESPEVMRKSNKSDGFEEDDDEPTDE